MLIFMYLSFLILEYSSRGRIWTEDGRYCHFELDVGIVCEGAPTQIEVSNTGVYP